MTPEIINFQIRGDKRGSLIALEQFKEVPFQIKRVYYIFDTQLGIRRGFHAHKKLEQVAVCVKGQCKFLLDDGFERVDIALQSNSQGLMIGKMIWHEMYDFSDDCVLMVLASDVYDESDYIRNHRKFQDSIK